MTPLPDARFAAFRPSAPRRPRCTLVARLALPVVLGALAMLTLAPAASGAVTAKTSLVTTNGATRIVVKLSGTAKLPLSKRPTAVAVKAGTRSFKLARVNATTWRSAVLNGPAAAAVRALGGKRVQVSVRSRGGTRTLRPVLSVPPVGAPATPPPPPAPPAPGAQPLFKAPASELIGNAAYEHFKQYFLTARFTDCPAGWPACSVEQRYDHCANGSFAYHRYTPTSGADINAYGTYTVTGAVARTDGSWVVEYVYDNYGSPSFYSWNVAANGIVTGNYWGPNTAPPSPPTESLGPLQYQSGATCE